MMDREDRPGGFSQSTTERDDMTPSIGIARGILWGALILTGVMAVLIAVYGG